MKQSSKSEKFLQDLRVYLFSSGKNSNEIEEIIEELEVHMREAERDGKPIEKVIGSSPEEYMASVSKEMNIDYKEWMKYIIFIIVGSFSFTIFTDLLNGTLSYSVLQIVGHIVISAIFIGVILKLFKYISVNNFSTMKDILLIFLVVIIPMSLSLGLIFANRAIESPVIHFGAAGSTVIGIVMALVVLGISLWARSSLLIIILALIILPEFFLEFTSFSEETKLMTSSLLTFVGIGIYLLILFKLEAKNE